MSERTFPGILITPDDADREVAISIMDVSDDGQIIVALTDDNRDEHLLVLNRSSARGLAQDLSAAVEQSFD